MWPIPSIKCYSAAMHKAFTAQCNMCEIDIDRDSKKEFEQTQSEKAEIILYQIYFAYWLMILSLDIHI